MDNIKQDDTFNDALVVTYKEDNHYIRRVFDVTTDPGKYYLINPTNKKGTAIIKPGQYVDAYAIGKHNNKYNALCQRLKDIDVYRDNNKDDILDMKDSATDKGMFGCNIHKSYNSGKVGKNSAGCTVFRYDNDFDSFMKMCERHSKLYGNKFTYTVIESKVLGNKIK